MNDLVTTISSLLSAVQSFIWGPPMIILLLGLGLLLTLKLRVLQIRKLSTALKMACTPHDGDPTKQGDVTSFAALCTALAATVGTANIAGVATAVSIGGPGALFWMFLQLFSEWRQNTQNACLRSDIVKKIPPVTLSADQCCTLGEE